MNVAGPAFDFQQHPRQVLAFMLDDGGLFGAILVLVNVVVDVEDAAHVGVGDLVGEVDLLLETLEGWTILGDIGLDGL